MDRLCCRCTRFLSRSDTIRGTELRNELNWVQSVNWTEDNDTGCAQVCVRCAARLVDDWSCDVRDACQLFDSAASNSEAAVTNTWRLIAILVHWYGLILVQCLLLSPPRGAAQQVRNSRRPFCLVSRASYSSGGCMKQFPLIHETRSKSVKPTTVNNSFVGRRKKPLFSV